MDFGGKRLPVSMIEDDAEQRAKCIIYVYVKTGINVVHASAASLPSMGTVSEVLSENDAASEYLVSVLSMQKAFRISCTFRRFHKKQSISMHRIRVVLYCTSFLDMVNAVPSRICPADATGPCTNGYLYNAPTTLGVSHRMSAGWRWIFLFSLLIAVFIISLILFLSPALSLSSSSLSLLIATSAGIVCSSLGPISPSSSQPAGRYSGAITQSRAKGRRNATLGQPG